MNDEELRRRLVEPIGHGGPGFWAGVDRTLAEVELNEGFVSALQDNDETVGPLNEAIDRPVVPPTSAWSVGSLRVALAAAAVMVVIAGGLAVGLTRRGGSDLVASDLGSTTQPAATRGSSALDDDGSTPDLAVEEEQTADPAGESLCFAEEGADGGDVARVEYSPNRVVSGYRILGVPDADADAPLVLDRFVGTRFGDGTIKVDATRFDGAIRERRNVDWRMKGDTLETEDVVLQRVDCATVAEAFPDAGLRSVRELADEFRTTARSIDLRPVDPIGTGAPSTVGFEAVEIRAGETVAFRFDAEAGAVIDYEVVAATSPSVVALIGPAGLAIAVGSAAEGLVIAHTGSHHLVVTADEVNVLSVAVSN